MNELDPTASQQFLFEPGIPVSTSKNESEIKYWPTATIVGSNSKVLPCCNRKINIIEGAKIGKKRCSNCGRTFYPKYETSEYLTEKLKRPAITVIWHEISGPINSSKDLTAVQLTLSF